MARLHAICTLDGLGKLTAETLEIALQDSDPTVRRHAIRLSEPLLSGDMGSAPALLSAVLRCDDSDPHVRQQLAYSLGYFDAPQSLEKLAEIAANSPDHPAVREAVISSLQPETLAAFYTMIQKNPPTADAYRDVILEMAARSGQTQFLSSLVKSLIVSIRRDTPDPDQLDALTRTLKTLRQKNVEMAPSTQTLAAELKTDAAQWASSAQASIPLRVASLGLLALEKRDNNVSLNLLAASQPTEVQIAAAESTVANEPDVIFQRLASLSPTVRQAALNAILAREATTSQLIAALQAKQVSTHAISDNHRRRLLAHPSDQVKTAATGLFGHPSSEAEKQAILKHYLASTTEPGDRQRGAMVFEKQCAACHRVNEIGHPVGPDLASLQDRSPKTLLTAIVDPNLAVEDRYQGYNILTLDGELLTGVISTESTTAIELQLQDGKRQSVLRDDIEWIRSTGISLMPEGFEKSIPPSEMNDLLTYLNSLDLTPNSNGEDTP